MHGKYDAGTTKVVANTAETKQKEPKKPVRSLAVQNVTFGKS
jgi:hypothetical protein